MPLWHMVDFELKTIKTQQKKIYLSFNYLKNLGREPGPEITFI